MPVVRCCAFSVISWYRISPCTEADITAGLNFGTVFVGRSGPSFQSRSEPGRLNFTGCDSWNTRLHCVQGGKAHEDGLASIDTFLRFFQPEQKTGTLGQLSHGTPVEPGLIKGPHRRDPSSRWTANQAGSRLPANPLTHSTE
jgi:hypothetical protein